MKKTASFLTLIAAIAAFFCQLSFAQSSASGSTKGTTDTATINFITNATVGNLKEVATGKLAGKKGQDPSVKAFGGKMVDHHTKATKEMAALVKSKGIKVPKPPVEMVAPDSSLAKSTGAEFDRMYVTTMVADHKKTIALFETASTSISDPDLKAFAVRTLPMLREHLAEIQGIASKMNISSAQ